MREVLFDRLMNARWEITEAICDADENGATGNTTLATSIPSTQSAEPVDFVFSLAWDARAGYDRVGDPEWDFNVRKRAVLEPVDDVLVVGEDDITWETLFADDWLFQDIILDGIWEAYTKADFIQACQEVY